MWGSFVWFGHLADLITKNWLTAWQFLIACMALRLGNRWLTGWITLTYPWVSVILCWKNARLQTSMPALQLPSTSWSLLAWKMLKFMVKKRSNNYYSYVISNYKLIMLWKVCSILETSDIECGKQISFIQLINNLLLHNLIHQQHHLLALCNVLTFHTAYAVILHEVGTIYVRSDRYPYQNIYWPNRYTDLTDILT